ncbi:MAG: TonB-dependent receptor, partial [Pyrinomonadaceae bacterium]|nr:TonB-dependent receptor [Pyrinomonadaceae bacterium]
MNYSARFFVAVLMFAALTTVAHAQFETATVLGSVRDANGAVLNSVVVTLKNLETGSVLSATSDGNGDYQFVNVRIGTYEVSGSREGFSTAVAANVTVTVNARQRVDLTLQPGALSESVLITDAAALLETDSSVRGQVIGSKQIVSLPLNGRSYADLALLVPGVRESNLNQNSIASKRDASFNVNGLRSTYNNFLLDGVDNNSYGTSNQGFSSQLVQLSPDAVTEFKVETNNYSAEFGRSGGATINASLRSGTNDFHGALWEFHRNTVLNARGFFANRNRLAKPNLIRNQFGGTFGGPIIRDRTFFFVNYEGFREVSSEVRTATLLTLEQRQGRLGISVRNPITGVSYAATDTLPVTPFAQRVLADLPTPNLPGASNNFASLARSRFFNDKGDLKIDHRFNDSTTAFVRVSHRKANNFEAPAIPGPSGGDSNGFVRVLNQQLAGGVTFTTSPTSLLEFRLGLARTRAGKTPPLVGGPSMRELYGISGLPEDPALTGGLTAQIIGGGFTSLGRQATNPQFQNPSVINPRANYSWLIGRHSFKAGYEYQAISTEVNDVNPLYGRDGYGGLSRPTGAPASPLYNLADFLLGARGQYALVTPFFFDLRQRMHFTYLQDDWKVNSKLTLNLGLRYEYATPQYEANNRLSNFDPTTNSLILADDGSIADRALVNPDRNNFAPRFGFAYQLTPRTVARGGYGIGYIHFNRSGGANLLPINGPQVVLAVVQVSPTSPIRPTEQGYPEGLTSPANFNPLTATVFHLPRDTRTGYVQSWHFTVQREITPNTLVDVAYVGNHSIKLLLFGDLNQARPNNPGENTPLQQRRPIAGFSAISTGFPVGFSNYHGLQIKFERRASRGLYLLNSFTWSKALDNVAQSLEDPNGNAASPQDICNLAAERGLSAYDQPINNTTSAIWELPLGRGRAFGGDMPAALNAIVGGWTITGVNVMTNGQPINLRYTTLPSEAFRVTADLAAFQGGVSLRPDVIGDPVTPRDGRTIDNYLNRNTVLVPSLASNRPFGTAGRNT